MSPTTSDSCEMPKYKCHKVVHALEIKSVVCHAHDDPNVTIEEFAKTAEFKGGHILPEDERFAPIPFDADYYKKHNPEPGGYYVVYEGGYKSWSPKEAFEGGYIKINDGDDFDGNFEKLYQKSFRAGKFEICMKMLLLKQLNQVKEI